MGVKCGVRDRDGGGGGLGSAYTWILVPAAKGTALGPFEGRWHRSMRRRRWIVRGWRREDELYASRVGGCFPAFRIWAIVERNRSPTPNLPTSAPMLRLSSTIRVPKAWCQMRVSSDAITSVSSLPTAKPGILEASLVPLSTGAPLIGRSHSAARDHGDVGK